MEKERGLGRKSRKKARGDLKEGKNGQSVGKARKVAVRLATDHFTCNLNLGLCFLVFRIGHREWQ